MTQQDIDVTGGVDTHKDTHTAAALDGAGRVLGTEQFAANQAGYKALLAWLRSFGPVPAVGVEGTGAYGSGHHPDQAAPSFTRPAATGPRRRSPTSTRINSASRRKAPLPHAISGQRAVARASASVRAVEPLGSP
ncbi:MAG TPA: transposase [Actinoplanes sp.]|jgi:hypothetical protein|nr:transposase [Actinoplanes sp.]